MINRIQNCFDSHTHFLATGQVASGLQLHQLKSASDFQNLKIKPEHYRSDWLIGFGWDENKWDDKSLPQKKDLDDIFPHHPVLFSRIDGHASLINTLAVEWFSQLGFDFDQPIAGGLIQRNQQGDLTGLLFDQAHAKALSLLPSFTDQQKKNFFERAQTVFNQAGFTHIRDLSMDLKNWEILSEMQSQNNLTLCVDSFVTIEKIEMLEKKLDEIVQIKKIPNPLLRLQGAKIFVDGSLGSKTAYLSENYLLNSTSGILIWSFAEIKEVLIRTWRLGLDVAIHTIGDQAVHTVIQAAREVSAKGILGRLHLEHVEILRPETIQLMKPLHVTCYMQPCHWLTDKNWLANILSPTLFKNIFQWELLRKNKIPFYFGSDSPIEKPFLLNTPKSLHLSSIESVPALQDDWKKYHSHPDKNWTKSWTEFDAEKIIQVYFNEEALLKN